MKFLKSLFCALNGIVYCLREESHLRFHIVVGFYVIVFSTFYGFSKTQFALILLVIAAVILLELINTAFERLCNLYSTNPHPLIRRIKDISAGAVLVSALFSIAIGIVLFFDIEVFRKIFDFFINNPLQLLIFIASLVLSVCFVLLFGNNKNNDINSGTSSTKQDNKKQ